MNCEIPTTKGSSLFRKLSYYFQSIFFLLFTGATNSRSLYDVPTRWKDERGVERTFGDFKGKPIVLSLMYTSCGTACPLTVERLKRIEKATAQQGSHPEFVLVSLEPKKDTSKKLAEYKQEKKLGDKWHLFQGNDDDVRALSVILGYSYQPDTSGKEIFHANKVLLLDPAGAVSVELEGLNSSVTPIVEKIVEFDQSAKKE